MTRACGNTGGTNCTEDVGRVGAAGGSDRNRTGSIQNCSSVASGATLVPSSESAPTCTDPASLRYPMILMLTLLRLIGHGVGDGTHPVLQIFGALRSMDYGKESGETKSLNFGPGRPARIGTQASGAVGIKVLPWSCQVPRSRSRCRVAPLGRSCRTIMTGSVAVACI